MQIPRFRDRGVFHHTNHILSLLYRPESVMHHLCRDYLTSFVPPRIPTRNPVSTPSSLVVFSGRIRFRFTHQSASNSALPLAHTPIAVLFSRPSTTSYQVRRSGITYHYQRYLNLVRLYWRNLPVGTSLIGRLLYILFRRHDAHLHQLFSILSHPQFISKRHWMAQESTVHPGLRYNLVPIPILRSCNVERVQCR
jgi:hypothetical protein